MLHPMRDERRRTPVPAPGGRPLWPRLPLGARATASTGKQDSLRLPRDDAAPILPRSLFSADEWRRRRFLHWLYHSGRLPL